MIYRIQWIVFMLLYLCSASVMAERKAFVRSMDTSKSKSVVKQQQGRNEKFGIRELSSYKRKDIYTILVNPDSEKRHMNNIHDALNTLSYHKVLQKNILLIGKTIVSANRFYKQVSLLTLDKAFRHVSERIAKTGQPSVVILYFTGHGGKVLPQYDSYLSTGNNTGLSASVLYKLYKKYLYKKSIKLIHFSDQCSGGGFAETFNKKGFFGLSFSQTQYDVTSCQLFSPYFWKYLRKANVSIAEAFHSAFTVYKYKMNKDKKNKENSIEVVGTVMYGPKRFSSNDSIKSLKVQVHNAYRQSFQTPIVIEVSTSWCSYCKIIKHLLGSYLLRANGFLKWYRFSRITSSDNQPMKIKRSNQIIKLFQEQFDGFPTNVNAYPSLFYIKNGVVQSFIDSNGKVKAFTHELSAVFKRFRKTHRFLSALPLNHRINSKGNPYCKKLRRFIPFAECLKYPNSLGLHDIEHLWFAHITGKIYKEFIQNGILSIRTMVYAYSNGVPAASAGLYKKRGVKRSFLWPFIYQNVLTLRHAKEFSSYINSKNDIPFIRKIIQIGYDAKSLQAFPSNISLKTKMTILFYYGKFVPFFKDYPVLMNLWVSFCMAYIEELLLLACIAFLLIIFAWFFTRRKWKKQYLVCKNKNDEQSKKISELLEEQNSIYKNILMNHVANAALNQVLPSVSMNGNSTTVPVKISLIINQSVQGLNLDSEETVMPNNVKAESIVLAKKTKV